MDDRLLQNGELGFQESFPQEDGSKILVQFKKDFECATFEDSPIESVKLVPALTPEELAE
jgi:hypothetical protein